MGSGHASASIKVAVALMEQGYEVVFITSSAHKVANFQAALKLYKDAGQFRMLELLPAIDPDYPGCLLEVPRQRTEIQTGQQQRSEQIKRHLNALGIDNIVGFIWEMVPLEVQERSVLHREFRDISVYLKQLDIPQYGLARDIIIQTEKPHTINDAIIYDGVKPEWVFETYQDMADYIHDHIETVFVRGNEKIIALDESCLTATVLDDKITHLDYFKALTGNEHPSKSRPKEVVLSIGGQWTRPRDKDIYTSVIDAWGLLQNPNTDLISDDDKHYGNRFTGEHVLRLILPDNTPEDIRESIRAYAANADEAIQVCSQLDNVAFGNLISHYTKLYIGRAGSTMGEMAAVDEPMVIIPRSNGVVDREQAMRAEAFERAGYCRIVWEPELNAPGHLAAMMVEALQARSTSLVQSSNPMDGAQMMAQQIDQDITCRREKTEEESPNDRVLLNAIIELLKAWYHERMNGRTA